MLQSNGAESFGWQLKELEGILQIRSEHRDEL
jgi:hypothetical protein